MSNSLITHCPQCGKTFKGIVYDTLDMIFLAKFGTIPEVEAGDDLAGSLWIAFDDIELERIAFSSLRQAVQSYLEIKDRGKS